MSKRDHVIAKKYFIYIHQNKINLKIYVGVTGNIRNRWNSQKSSAYNKYSYNYYDPFYRAIRKYGWDSFRHIIVEDFDLKQDALEAEKFWIEFFRSNIKKFGSNYGYNQSSGGEYLTDKNWEFRNNLSRKMSGTSNPMFGKSHSEQTKKKISETKNKNPMSKEIREKFSKLYTIVLTDAQVNSICSDRRSQSEIAKSHGVSRGVIKRILKENGIFFSPHAKILIEISKEQLITALQENLNCKETARKLNISTITLYRKLKLLLREDSFALAQEKVLLKK